MAAGRVPPEAQRALAGKGGPAGLERRAAAAAASSGRWTSRRGWWGPPGWWGRTTCTAAEPLLATQAAGIAQALAHGQIKTKSEATKKFVAEVLKQKLKMQSKALTDKIAESLQDDPNFSQRLDRMWSKG